MKLESFIPPEGEKLLFQTKRRAEWGMAVPCLISAPLLLYMAWGSSPLIWVLVSLLGLAFAYYSLRLILCAGHDWVVLTDRQVILCTYNLLFREIMKSCTLDEISGFRQFQSFYATKKKKNNGDLELTLKDRKKFSIPTLEGMGEFLEKLQEAMNPSSSEKGEENLE